MVTSDLDECESQSENLCKPPADTASQRGNFVVITAGDGLRSR